jgi:benzoyl-CoA reductase/2-hydroxyglutaryl-CoA dehydratase subunit BcrC/BadD/HgdB
MKRREKQFVDFMALAQEKEDRATMKDHREKVKKLNEKKGSGLSASQMRGKLLTNNLVKAYNPDATVVWHSLFMPTEIFYAMDMVPFSTEMVAAGIAGAGLGKKFVESGEEYLGCRDSCSFITCSYGGITMDVFPEPDFIVTTSQLCDPERKLARFASRRFDKKEFFIDVPYGALGFEEARYREAVDYLAGQFENMVEFLEKQSGRKLDLDRLSQVFDYSNQTRDWFIKINELREGPGVIRGAKALDFSAVLLNIWGTPEALDIYKTLYQELLTSNPSGQLTDDKYRIGWVHLRPYYDNTLFDYLETECGVSVVAEEVNYIFWDKLDIEKPFHSLARKVLANPMYSPVEQKFDIYRHVFNNYRIEGLIGFAHKGCRHYYSAIHLAAEYFKDKLPMLVIDGDCIDPRAYSFPLLKIRVDAFLETIDSRRMSTAN